MCSCANTQCFCDGNCNKSQDIKLVTHVGLPPIPFEGIVTTELIPQGIKPKEVENTTKSGEEDMTVTALTQREVELREACLALADILVAKNQNYGDSFKKYYDKRGPVSVEMRLEDKMNRLSALIDGEPDKVGESLADTLLDIAGYGILSYIEEKRKGDK